MSYKNFENPESKSILLAPFLQEGIPIGVASTINYSVSGTPIIRW